MKKDLINALSFLISAGKFPAACGVVYLRMPKSENIHKSHNVSVLLYHYVLLAKYRRAVFSTISKYVKEQGREKEYQALHKITQLALF